MLCEDFLNIGTADAAVLALCVRSAVLVFSVNW